MSSSFGLLEQVQLDDNPVPIPRSARICKGNHKWDNTIVNNKAIGYVPVRYEHQEFPRLMYHPEWGAKPKPEAARYFVGAVTQEQMQNAMNTYTEAEQKWARSNRTKLITSQKEFDKLAKIGWLAKPPIRKENPQFDLESDEL